MPVLRRCRSKTPAKEAMKASPDPRKLKKAAKSVKTKQKEKVKGPLTSTESVKTPSPKPILKNGTEEIYHGEVRVV